MSNEINNAERIERLRTLLESNLSPDHLEIIDESHLHAGHAGARGGHAHLKVIISAAAFKGQSLIKQHRMVYAAAGDMLQTDIHALTIDARTSG